MERNREALKTAHGNFAKALDDFAKMVLASATGREVAVKNASVAMSPDSANIIIRSGGSCGVYDSSTGTCRPCTPEEDQGEIIPG